MKTHRVGFLVLVALLFSAIASTANAEEFWHSGCLGDYMTFRVISPFEVKINEVFTVSFSFKVLADIHVSYLTVEIKGAASWKKTLLLDTDLKSDIEMVETVTLKPKDYGLIYCDITVEYTRRWIPYFSYAIFDISYSRYLAYDDFSAMYSDLKWKYENLSDTYSRLLSSYDSLQSDYSILNNSYRALSEAYFNLLNDYDNLQLSYDDLKLNYESLSDKYYDLESSYNIVLNDLNNTRNSLYIFIASTIAFMITSVYFATKKPKPSS